MQTRRALGSGTAAFGLALGFASLVAGAPGCGWIGPGDYKMYKMEVTAKTQSSGCFYPDSANPNKESDTDTALGNAMWVLTVDTSDNLFLDLGDHSVKGAENDNGYGFTEKQVDVTFENNDAKKTKHTETTSTSISFTVEGKSIGGTATVTHSIACEGSNCGPSIPDCVESYKFSGTEIDDVQLHYIVK